MTDSNSPQNHEIPGDSAESFKARYVWQRMWFQWVLGTIVFFLFLSFVLPPIFWVIGRLSPVLTPVLLGLGLAYLFNPLTAWAERRHGIRRPMSAGVVLALAVLVLLATVPMIIVSAIEQGAVLIEKFPTYAQTVLGWLGSDTQDAEQRVRDFIDSLDWTKVDSATATKALGVGAGAIFTGLSFAASAAIFVLVTAFCFFVFSWKFEELKAWFAAFVPKPYREETFRIMGKMDLTISAIVRGRLVQSLVIMVVLSVGWSLTGVQYWLLVGVLGGVLNLLPFAAVLSWPLAVILAVMDKANGGTMAIVGAIIWPSVVYIIAQAMDGWVVEPLVQGKATGMDALTVLLVVLAGGALMGILGVVLAVPVAACIKILSQELLLPKLRSLAENPPDIWQKSTPS